MIQFVLDPKIQKTIEQALRNDNLVFFCGAGISIPSGLPSFNHLVEQVCEELKVDIDNNSLLESAKKRGDYASILDLLEGNQEFSVQPKILRKKIINILRPPRNGKTDIHKALLELSALPDNRGHRLVTTNFDRLFFEAGLKSQFSDSAPKLAPPKKGKWRNLTFLHGVIDKANDPKGENLVLTRSDFGLAYLHDRWASRFVTQLFQEFTVVFIGYSANDPVLNYLVSAISYENKRRSEAEETGNRKKNPSIYAFVGYEEGKKEEKENHWKSIGVKPIPYKIKDNNNYSLLYDIIKKLAKSKRISLAERKIWLKNQLKIPYKEEVDKEKTETVISALKIDDRLAEYLPEINLSSDPKKRKPVDISWLKAFSGEKKESKNNSQSNNSLPTSNELETKNSLLTKLTGWTALSSPHNLWKPLSPLEKNIAHWLLHHLDKKELIHWLIKQAPPQTGLISLHPEFKNRIKWRLKRIQTNSNEKLDQRKALFWEIVTSQKDQIKNLPFYEGQLITALNQNYSYAKARDLLFCLEPQIGFEIYFYDKKFSDLLGSDKIYETKLVINAHYYPDKILTNEKTLLSHAEDFSDLLKKAMELAEWAERYDSSYIQRPSITAHQQNKKYYPWTYLIDLVKDSFDLAMDKNKTLAELLLNKWRSYPYSLFYRLILYAITKHSDLKEEIAIKLFEEKPNQTLWLSSCRNEVLRYLSGRQHAEKETQKLLSLIMKGPDRSLYKADIDENYFTELKERAIYLRLHHLKFSDAQFPEDIEKYYKEIPVKYSFAPSKKESAEREGFPVYMEGPKQIGSEKHYHNMTNEQIFNDIKYTRPNTLPTVDKKEQEFRSFFKEHPDGPERAFQILSMFPDNDLNSAPYWKAFIFESYGMTDAKKSKEWFLKSFNKIKFNDNLLTKCLWALIEGLKLKSKLIYAQDKEDFKKRWNKLWDLSIKDKEYFNYSNIPDGALNSNLGKLSQSVFDILWSTFPDGKIPENGKIPKDIKTHYFKIVLQKGKKKDPSVLFHFGSYLPQLWRLDKEWTINNLKSLMGWDGQKTFPVKNKSAGSLSSSAKKSPSQNSTQDECAWKALWQGYLFYNMFLGPDFLEDFKKEFFQLILNYEKIISNETDYLSTIAEIFFITTGGREAKSIFTEEEESQLIQKIGIDILEFLSWYIWRFLENLEKGKSAVLWSEKIKPWIEKFWPPQKNKMSPKIARNLSLAILHCGNKLPEAFEFLKDKIEGVIIENSGLDYNIAAQTGLADYDIIEQIDLDEPLSPQSSQAESLQDKPNDSTKNKQPEDSRNKLNHIFDYPNELLQLLNWNFPKNRISDGENIKKILNKLKAKHPDIEQNEQYKKLLDKIT